MAGLRIFLLLGTSWLVASVHGYSTGGPDEACDSLMPSHGAPAQNSVSPFKITTSATTVGSGQQITVTVAGTADLKGFFLRARQRGVFIDGVFQESSFGALRCNGQGITHNNPAPKNNLKIQWTAPASLAAAPIQIVGTIIQQKTLFWTEVASADVTVMPGASGGGSVNVVSPPTGSGGSQGTGSGGSQGTGSGGNQVKPGPSGSKNGGNDTQVRAGWITICLTFLFLCFCNFYVSFY